MTDRVVVLQKVKHDDGQDQAEEEAGVGWKNDAEHWEVDDELERIKHADHVLHSSSPMNEDLEADGGV